MQPLASIFLRLVREEEGGEVLEYSIVTGMVSIIALAIIASFARRVADCWRPMDQPFE